MPPHEIIDLSLDTDDEVEVDVRVEVEVPRISKLALPVVAERREGGWDGGDSGFRCLSDYEDLGVGDGDGGKGVGGRRKRRRVSPGGVSDDGIEVVGEFAGGVGGGERGWREATAFMGSRDGGGKPGRGEAQNGGTRPNAHNAGSRNLEWLDIEDPIMFTSSPNGDGVTSRSRRKVSREVSPLTDDEIVDIADLRSGMGRVDAKPGLQLPARTAALLSALAENPRVKKPGRKRQKETLLEDTTETSANARKTKLTDAEKETRKVEKERLRKETAQKKLKDREEEQERKRIQKEEKAREKRVAADLAEVNKVRTDKKISTPEMIVDLPSSMEGKTVDTQIREFLKTLQVQATTYSSPVPNVIKWRRKVSAQFNEELGHWQPVPQSIQAEKHILCLLTAKEFAAMASADATSVDGQDLESHVLQLKTKYADSTPIYLIEGLEALLRKNINNKNRAYQAAVLSQMQMDDGQGAAAAATGSTAAAISKRGKKPVPVPVPEHLDEDMLEDALLRLQVTHGCLIHHTAAAVHTAEWVATFTQHISTIPYRSVDS